MNAGWLSQLFLVRAALPRMLVLAGSGADLDRHKPLNDEPCLRDVCGGCS
jgi:hypothetical protein